MKYDPALDGLRGVSVLAVVVYHFYPAALPGGWAGVEVFFVLSGFLITTILMREIDRTGGIRLGDFYLRRALRLAPALLAVIAVQLALLPLQHRPVLPSLGEIASAATYTMNFYRAFGWGPEDALGHTWSLAMEEQFYLLWPPFLLLCPRRWWRRATIALLLAVTAWRIALVLHGAPPNRTSDGFDTHCDALLIGCVSAFVAGAAAGPARLVPLWTAAGAGGFAAVALLAPLASPLVQSAGLGIVALLAVAMLVAARAPGRFRDTMLFAPLVHIGRISYGLYLWHYPILVLAIRHVPHALIWVPMLASYPLALLSFRFIERPFLRLKDRLPGASPGSAARDLGAGAAQGGPHCHRAGPLIRPGR